MPASMAPAHASVAPSYAPQAQAQKKKGNGAVIALVFGGVVALSAAGLAARVTAPPERRTPITSSGCGGARAP